MTRYAFILALALTVFTTAANAAGCASQRNSVSLSVHPPHLLLGCGGGSGYFANFNNETALTVSASGSVLCSDPNAEIAVNVTGMPSRWDVFHNGSWTQATNPVVVRLSGNRQQAMIRIRQRAISIYHRTDVANNTVNITKNTSGDVSDYEIWGNNHGNGFRIRGLWIRNTGC